MQKTPQVSVYGRKKKEKKKDYVTIPSLIILIKLNCQKVQIRSLFFLIWNVRESQCKYDSRDYNTFPSRSIENWLFRSRARDPFRSMAHAAKDRTGSPREEQKMGNR